MKSQLSTTILLVEDNEDDVFAMSRALNLGKFLNPLQIVPDGQQALDYLSGTGQYINREVYPLPFIVFLDLKLPYVDGFEVLAWIRQQPLLESIVVIILTSSAEERDHQRAYALGARTNLVKPPTPECIANIFGSLKSYWMSKTGFSPVIETQTELAAL